jgi:hypothetical protein
MSHRGPNKPLVDMKSKVTPKHLHGERNEKNDISARHSQSPKSSRSKSARGDKDQVRNSSKSPLVSGARSTSRGVSANPSKSDLRVPSADQQVQISITSY